MTFLPIANPPNKPTPVGADKLLGTDSADGSTKNFAVSALATVMAAQGPAGPAGMVWRGAWSSATAYASGDGVSSGGSSYIATAANTNSQPPSANWNLLAQQGAAGSAGSAPAPVTVAANATVTTAQRTILVDATGAARTITLYTAVGNAGKEIRVKKIAGANAVTIAAAGSETIDGAATLAVAGINDSYSLESDGAVWRVI